MRKRWIFILFAICSISFVVTACFNDKRIVEQDVPITEQLDSIDPETQTETPPLKTSEPEVTTENAEVKELLERNFTEYFKLPEGYRYTNFVMKNEDELAYTAWEPDTDPRKYHLAVLNLNTRDISIIWEGTETLREHLLRTEAALDGVHTVVKFGTYDREMKAYKAYRIDSGEVIDEIHEQRESPNGHWIAIDDMNTENGIWGIHTDSGEKVQWTKGQWDSQVLWLPDSSGFIYLHSTGNRLGDGAGPEFALAKYDMNTKTVSQYPMKVGYWGRIAWLVPGLSILSRNGFDDGVGYKFVNLQDETEQQMYSSTSRLEFVNQTFNPTTGKILIIEDGRFLYYDKMGEPFETVPWITGLDEFTQKNPEFESDKEGYHPFYKSSLTGGMVGPSMPKFSPDGRHLTYTLGAIDQSSDNIVPGNRIIISNRDGTDPSSLMNDYFHVLNYQWTPSSERIVVLFELPELQNEVYIGMIHNVE